MNAKQMIAKLDGYGGIIPFNSEELDVTLRALRLLAAAEASDGTTPETEAAIEACGRDFGKRLPGNPMVVLDADFASRLERERNGLAARVVELEAIRTQMVDAADATLCDPSGQVVIHGSAADLDILQSAIDAARSKP